jgi:hydrogenase expression/formation protein HypC
MCLGIPGKLVAIEPEGDILMGKVQFGGITKNVCLEHVPTAKVGDYVLVHVGFALSLIDEQEAQHLLALLDELKLANELEDPQPGDPEVLPA